MTYNDRVRLGGKLAEAEKYIAEAAAVHVELTLAQFRVVGPEAESFAGYPTGTLTIDGISAEEWFDAWIRG